MRLLRHSPASFAVEGGKGGVKSGTPWMCANVSADTFTKIVKDATSATTGVAGTVGAAGTMDAAGAALAATAAVSGASSSTFVYRGQSARVDALEDRIERVLSVPAAHGLTTQFLRYHHSRVDTNVSSSTTAKIGAGSVDQLSSSAASGYGAHTDCAAGLPLSNRALTILIYLTDEGGSDFSGGATLFPQLNISVAPKRGTLVLFDSLDEQGYCSSLSKHVAAAVAKGAQGEGSCRADGTSVGGKYVVQKWYTARCVTHALRLSMLLHALRLSMLLHGLRLSMLFSYSYWYMPILRLLFACYSDTVAIC
jgi:hypothetical protein